MLIFHSVVCLRVAFERKVEKNWKIIAKLNSVDGQASSIDEGYLLIINFLCET